MCIYDNLSFKQINKQINKRVRCFQAYELVNESTNMTNVFVTTVGLAKNFRAQLYQGFSPQWITTKLI